MSTDPKTAEERIARAIELDKAACDGPWRHCCASGEGCGGVMVWEEGDQEHPVAKSDSGHVNARNNMAFIAESRALLPALANDARQAREELEIERACVDDYSDIATRCLAVLGVDIESLARKEWGPEKAAELNALRRSIPDRIASMAVTLQAAQDALKDAVADAAANGQERDQAIARAEKAETELAKRSG